MPAGEVLSIRLCTRVAHASFPCGARFGRGVSLVSRLSRLEGSSSRGSTARAIAMAVSVAPSIAGSTWACGLVGEQEESEVARWSRGRESARRHIAAEC